MFIEIKKDYEKLIKDYNDELETSRHRALRIAELQAQADKLAEAISNFKKQADLYGGDYLPGNYIQMSEALADYEAWKGK